MHRIWDDRVPAPLSPVINSLTSPASWHFASRKQSVYLLLATSINVINRVNVNIETIFHTCSLANKIEYFHYLNKMMKCFID